MTYKSTGTSCEMGILFLIQTTKFLIKYNLLNFVSKFLVEVFFIAKICNQFHTGNKKDISDLKTTRWIFIP
jgi:hypothetical protein